MTIIFWLLILGSAAALGVSWWQASARPTPCRGGHDWLRYAGRTWCGCCGARDNTEAQP